MTKYNPRLFPIFKIPLHPPPQVHFNPQLIPSILKHNLVQFAPMAIKNRRLRILWRGRLMMDHFAGIILVNTKAVLRQVNGQ